MEGAKAGFTILHSLVIFSLMIGCSGAQKTTTSSGNSNQGVTEPDSSQTSETTEKKEKEPIIDSIDLLYPPLLKDTYQIAFCLPLYLDDYPGISGSREHFSTISMDYWWGAKLAFDTLEAIGMSAEIQIIDGKNDSSEIKSQIKNLKKKPDLLFGPLFPTSLAHIAPYLDKNGINAVSSFAVLETTEGYNHRTIFSKSTLDKTNKTLAAFLSKGAFKRKPIVIFSRTVDYEQNEAKNLKKKFTGRDSNRVELRVLSGNYVGKNELKGSIKDSAVVIICSDREAFVTSILAEMRRSLKNFTVVGKSSWLDYQSCDINAWERLNMHFYSSQYLDYSDSLTQKFIQKFRKKYRSEPSKHAISGYFETIYYGLYLHTYGVNFQRHINELELQLPYFSSEFKQAKKPGFFYNANVSFYKLSEQQLKKLK